MKKLFIALFIALMLVSNAYAVGTITGTASEVVGADGAKFLRVVLTCTADAAAATYPATAVGALATVGESNLFGLYLYCVGAYPGTTAPTDATDLTITQDGIDLLGGYGTNLIDATSYTSCLAGTATGAAPMPITGDITINISNNAVNSAVVTLILTFVGM